jgi:hypothetical protein
MDRLCSIPSLRPRKADVEYGPQKQPGRCNAAAETLQGSDDEPILQQQPNCDYSLGTSNTAKITKMPLTLLDLPLVLVRDILNHVVESYTTHQSLSLRALLCIKQTNRKSLSLHSHCHESDG